VKVFGPQAIDRFNLFTSVKSLELLMKGFSSGDAIKAVEEVASQSLPIGYGYEYSGMTARKLVLADVIHFLIMSNICLFLTCCTI
jgi:HAE1 family hydrophobic/amphiphilic exporter-1